MALSSSLTRGASVALALFSTCIAQIGDRLDRPGDVQKSLVPAELIPPAPALTPDEAMKTFKIAPGYRIELAAAEPQVQEPVAIAFGPDGRMWVVEMRGYMPDLDGKGEDAPVGRVVVLRDADGDGRFEESKVFVDQLVLPRAVALVGDGVLIGAPPELAFYRDTDGDGKAAKKDVIATDYGVKVDPKRPHLANPERAPNSLLWAFDNWIYSAAYTKKFRFVNGQWETASTSFRGQWGLSQDEFGRLYHGSNSDSLRVDVVHSDYLARNRNFARLAGTNVNAAENQLVWPSRVTPGINRGYRPEMLREGRLKEFTAACGWWVYRGDLLPELHGNVFVAEPAAHFVRRFTVTAENGTVRGKNPHERDEFLTSTDERFRPVSFATGPDGALYVVDLYRGVLQHRISLTSYLRKQSEERGLVDPQHLGRIYRIVPDKAAKTGAAGRKMKAEPKSTAEWVERLADANEYWREAAQRVLVERGEKSATDAVRAIARADGNPSARVHALWTLEGMGTLDRETVAAAFDAKESVVQAHATRLSERWLKTGEGAGLVERLLGLAREGVAEVQLQAVLSLGFVRDPKINEAVGEIVRASGANTFLTDAFFSGIAGAELTLLETFLGRWPAEDANANKILTGLVRGATATREAAAAERVIAAAGRALASGGSKRAVALIEGLVPTAGASRRPFQLEREPEGWAVLEKNATAKARLERLRDVVTWPGKPGVAALAAVKPLTQEQAARFTAGKPLFETVCASCHQVDGRGLDGLAPPLLDSEWVLGSPERTVRIVLHGVRGPITVLGRVHTGDMPAFGALDDQQISSILTYLRRAWGHTASAVDPEQVKAIRAATAGHTDAWSPEELNLIK